MTAVVAVLAGGRGRRLGEPKALADVGGAPLIARPLAAAAAAGLEAVVVARRATALPDGVTVWHEPDEPVRAMVGGAAIDVEADVLRSVNTPGELAAAREELA